jgi:hypothetical protein
MEDGLRAQMNPPLYQRYQPGTRNALTGAGKRVSTRRTAGVIALGADAGLPPSAG